LAELSAIAKLEDVSKTKTFATAMAAATARPIKSAGNMVLHPIGTVEGLPSGVGRLFGRVTGGAEQLWNTASASNQSGLERTEDAAKQAGTITRDALGYEQERRNLAKKLGVDRIRRTPCSLSSSTMSPGCLSRAALSSAPPSRSLSPPR